ncbi:hypothetical protein BOX37_27225 [Nocardia mangyaensis]|uniref:Uncharacterized protein n=1 Tax=Nocardia mangyaensis TaxID=2213200 RepID=A0A1J0VY37_9NOCA|nr:hypothetical protein [Nocardia mangyaensis]APE37008.1 hypothetical protein BOX37_27225 [Nocardia mangyaensis]
MTFLGRAVRSARPRGAATPARNGMIQQVATVATYSQLGQQVVQLPGQLAGMETRAPNPPPGAVPAATRTAPRSAGPGLVAVLCWTLLGSAVFTVAGSLAEGNAGGAAAGVALVAVGAVGEVLRRVGGTRSRAADIAGPRTTEPNRQRGDAHRD